MLNIVFLLACTLFGQASALINYKTNKDLDDSDPIFLNETYYAGLQTIQDQDSLFFWAFESRNDPSTDPLVVWLPGGPACSGEVSLFIEHGPYKIDKEANSLVINPYSWNNIANLLYVDVPLGNGFSTGSSHEKRENDIAEEFFEFLKEFLDTFPQFKNRDLYITGESYGAHLIPAIGKKLLTNKKQLEVNFKGVSIGNSLISPQNQYSVYADYAFSNKLITSAQFQKIDDGFRICKETFIKRLDAMAMIQCRFQYERILTINELTNIYDIRERCNDLPLCYDFSFIDDFLTKPEVEKAIGVSGKAWEKCEKTMRLELTEKLITDFVPELSLLLQEDIQVLLYFGEKDLVFNWRGGEVLSENLEWKGSVFFKKINYKFESKYQHRSLANLAFVSIFEAGHMVSFDQPIVSLEIIERFIKGWK